MSIALVDTSILCEILAVPGKAQAPHHAMLDEFPEWVKQGSGVGDLAIKKEFDRQCVLNPRRRVYIWSKDGHLAAFDRPGG